MTDELLELSRMRADLPPADEAAMARARAALVHTATSAPTRRHRRSGVRIAATAAVGAAAVATFAIAPITGAGAPAASAVTINDDGTVTMEVTDLTDFAAANQVLADAGIRAKLVTSEPDGAAHPGCAPGTELELGEPLPMPDGLLVPVPREQRQERMLIFRPDRIPAGQMLVMLAGQEGHVRAWHVEDDGQSPSVVPLLPAELHPESSGTCVGYPELVGGPGTR